MLDGGIIHVANLNAIIVNADAIGKNSPKFLLLVGPVSVHQQVGQMQALRRPFGYVLRRAQDDDWAIGVVGQKQNRLGPGTAQGLPVLPQDNWLLDDIIPPAQNNLTTDANPVQSLLNAIPSGDRRDLARLRETRQWNEEEQAKKNMDGKWSHPQSAIRSEIIVPHAAAAWAGQRRLGICFISVHVLNYITLSAPVDGEFLLMLGLAGRNAGWQVFQSEMEMIDWWGICD
jgi:hypothetical protein